MTLLIWLLAHGQRRWSRPQLIAAVAASVLIGGGVGLGDDPIGSAALVGSLVLGAMAWRTPRSTKRSLPWTWVGLALVVDAVCVGGLWASWATPPPSSWSPATWPHVLGTDALGNDVVQLWMRAGRTSLLIATIAGLLSVGLGCVAGTVAAVQGGAIDSVVMRLTDGVMSLPLLPVLLVLAAVPASAWQAVSALGGPLLLLGAALLLWARLRSVMGLLMGAVSVIAGAALLLLASTGTISDVTRLVVLLGAFAWVRTARLVRTQVQQLMSSGWWQASRALGADHWQRFQTLVWPHLKDTLLAALALDVASAFVAEAALSYLGLGLMPPMTSWGRMLLGALQNLQQHPLLVLLPALSVLGVSWLLHRLAEGVRSSLDPGSI